MYTDYTLQRVSPTLYNSKEYSKRSRNSHTHTCTWIHTRLLNLVLPFNLRPPHSGLQVCIILPKKTEFHPACGSPASASQQTHDSLWFSLLWHNPPLSLQLLYLSITMATSTAVPDYHLSLDNDTYVEAALSRCRFYWNVSANIFTSSFYEYSMHAFFLLSVQIHTRLHSH